MKCWFYYPFLLLWVVLEPIHTFQSTYGGNIVNRCYRLFQDDSGGMYSGVESREKINQLKNKLGVVLDKTIHKLQKNETVIKYVNQETIPTIIDVQPLMIEDGLQDQHQLEELKKLGYNDEDIYILKDTVKYRLVEMQLPRPANIPSIWLKKEIRRNLSQIPETSTDSSASKVRWVNVPRADIDKRNSPSNRFSQEESDGLDVWPSREEFKDLLLEESKLRVNTVGSWIAPLVRTENRWRFKLYEAWLRLLQEGFGDQVDIVDNDTDIELRNNLMANGRSTKRMRNPSQPVKKRIIRSQEEYDEFIRQQQQKISDFIHEEEQKNKPKKILRKVDRFLGTELLSAENDLFQSKRDGLLTKRVSRPPSTTTNIIQNPINPISNSYDSDDV